MYNYLGTARNVRELKKLLDKVDATATITLKSDAGVTWSYVEVLVSEAGDDVMLK